MSADDQRPAAPLASEATLDQAGLDEARIDDLFRRAVARRPHALALADPPNRASFTAGPVRQLTYQEADRIISALAARLRALHDRDGAVVGLQIANTVESVLAFLAVLRAGLVAMPMPLLWRHVEAVAALQTAGASALIVSSQVGDTDHFELAVRLAAQVFSVRQVYGFGGAAPDGAVSLDGLLAAADSPPATDSQRAAAAERPAVMTFDVSPQRLMPVRRNDTELIAGGLAVVLESAIPQDAVILSTILGGSFGSLATALVPWLITGGTLALHHPFDGAVLSEQLRETGCTVAVVPGPLLAALGQSGLLSPAGTLDRVIALWRSPEQLARATHWEGRPALVDVQVFGETGLVAGRRGPTGMPAAMPLGQVTAPRGDQDGRKVIEVERTPAGMLALRGSMLPHASRPLGDANGFIDTGFPCRVGRDGLSIKIAGPPPGLIGCGGYRFVMQELCAMVRRVDPDAILIALPDLLSGHRLAGFAADRKAARTALQEIGANPLLAAAFSGNGRQRTADGGRIED